MKLFYSPASPFVRKVLACAIAREIAEQIELIPTATASPPDGFHAANPLGKIPALITADGVTLFDSPVICEYLDSLEGTIPLFPSHGGLRWKALKLQALADGIMDAAVLRRGESLRPAEDARSANMERQKAAVARALAALEAEPPHQTVDIGSIAVACALGYLDFRYAHEPWRETHPKLALWFASFRDNPCIARTEPA